MRTLPRQYLQWSSEFQANLRSSVVSFRKSFYRPAQAQKPGTLQLDAAGITMNETGIVDIQATLPESLAQARLFQKSMKRT